jgi:S-adenosylmethionine:tRNA ribosyltransferase-isomerase
MLAQMEEDLKLESYDYHLPDELVAQRPLPDRHSSKLLVYHHPSGEVLHRHFYELAEFLPADTTLVFNNSKVIPCRLLGHKMTGGHCEIFLLSFTPLEQKEQSGEKLYPALIRTTRSKKIGESYLFPDPQGKEVLTSTIRAHNPDGTFALSFDREEVRGWFERYGLTPIPPYIRKGESDLQDKEEYQTIYAREEGSVAAPTAGFHFTPQVFAALEKKGVSSAYLSLHVGRGTFSPVKCPDICQHRMHEEVFYIDRKNHAQIQQAQRIIPVGTTVLRALQSVANLQGGWSWEPERHYRTDIFLYPGKEIYGIRGLITNFHLPESSLLMLVSAVIGRKKILELYQQAIEQRYRFYSYGDAMLILLE